MKTADQQPGPRLSLGIIAWNEEEAIEPMLKSLFRQTVFDEVRRRGGFCEVLCMANGCTDRTPEIARRLLADQQSRDPSGDHLQARCLEWRERGKINTWNRFVHEVSKPESDALLLMDGDILLREPETLWRLYEALREHPEVKVTIDHPWKDIALKQRPGFWERLSLATTGMTQAEPGQLTGQLYCIRAETARNLYLPKDLAACEDGFIKQVVCRNFLTEPLSQEAILKVDGASHVYEAYVSPREIFRNQKRQMIGQTIVHVLIDRHLHALPLEQRRRLGDTLRRWDRERPDWLRELIGDHIRQAGWFGGLFPGLLEFRWRRWRRLKGWKKVTGLPAMAAGTAMAALSGWAAYRHLRRGYAGYWPDTHSPALEHRQYSPIPGKREGLTHVA